MAPGTAGGPAAGSELAVEEGLLAQMPAIALGIESDSHDEEDQAEDASQPSPGATRRCRLQLRWVLLAGTALGFAMMAAATLTGQRAPRSRADIRSSVGLDVLDSFGKIEEEVARGIEAADDLIARVNETYQNATYLFDRFGEASDSLVDSGVQIAKELARPGKWKILLRQLDGMTAAEKEKWKRKHNVTSWARQADVYDGNVCPDQEEFHDGLCYMRCSMLADGAYPYRSSAWSCCSRTPPCTASRSKADLRVCDSPGGDAKGGCPHARGSCLLSEELWDGYCYKRCSLITFGILPERRGPSTCCSKRNSSRLKFGGMDGGCDTDALAYSIGGGAGGRASSPRAVQLPPSALTRATQ